MKLYIPEHLLALGVVKQLSQLVSAYESLGIEESVPIDSLNKDDSVDPVKRFIQLCISPNQEIFIKQKQTYGDVVNYIATMFYTVKGTSKVLEYMKKFLGFKEGSIVYDVNSLSIYPSSQSIGDESLYYDYLMGFLSELLYFEDLKTDLGAVNLNINYKVTSKVLLSRDIHCYKKIIVRR